MRAKIARPPEARRQDRPKGGRSGWWGLPKWPWRRPLTIKLTYRGGAEAWVEIHARGRVVRRPGHVHLIEVFAEIARQG